MENNQNLVPNLGCYPFWYENMQRNEMREASSCEGSVHYFAKLYFAYDRIKNKYIKIINRAQGACFVVLNFVLPTFSLFFSEWGKDHLEPLTLESVVF